jgi:hypothetical protein
MLLLGEPMYVHDGVIHLSVDEAAAELRRELRRRFSATRFVVIPVEGQARLVVSWTSGPSADEVRAITSKYVFYDSDPRTAGERRHPVSLPGHHCPVTFCLAGIECRHGEDQ